MKKDKNMYDWSDADFCKQQVTQVVNQNIQKYLEEKERAQLMNKH